MWSFLVVSFGALGYALFSVWNAKLVPSPEQVRGRLEAEHMLVFHVGARKLCEPGLAACGYGQNVMVPVSALPSTYKDADKWRARMEATGWLTTYSAGQVTADRQFMTALGKYANGVSIKVGWWDDTGKTCVPGSIPGRQPCLSQKVR